MHDDGTGTFLVYYNILFDLAAQVSIPLKLSCLNIVMIKYSYDTIVPIIVTHS